MKNIAIYLLLLCGVHLQLDAQTSKGSFTFSGQENIPVKLSESQMQAAATTSLRYVQTEGYAWDIDSNGDKQDYSYHLISKYDKNGNLISDFRQSWVDFTHWENSFRDTLYYKNGKQTGRLVKTWDNVGNTWVDFNLEKIDYDAAKRTQFDTLKTSDNTDWVYKSSIVTITAPDGKDSIRVYEDVSGFVPMKSIDTFYHKSGGRLTLETSSLWDYNTSTYFPSNRTMHFYDKSGKEVSRDYYSFNRSTGVFYLSQRDSILYDSRGNKIEDRYLTPDGAGGFKKSFHYVYLYDVSNNKIQESSEGWMNNGWTPYYTFRYKFDQNHNQIESKQFNYNNNKFYNGTMWSYTFQSISGIEDEKGGIANVKVFPMPATDNFIISQAGNNTTNSLISIYDMQGREVYSGIRKAGESQHIISCGNWPSGIYSLRITKGAKMIISQIVKE